ncbi:peroxide stress protein YaaA [Phaeobacter gallaeciensis]|uniref:peroxide stress protein YaaA n=1 Tax=Phaeobacter gallaeciensis TaxID=60890 RepID=UPI00237F69A5|nr:peroxide stress protein YaaA [Phaeobacter gallaeciensis]MDE4304720.1 peroxide stress protein YaaA [Phaeobacter gallaeciensis]MDE4308722.1 peroxide stress protein YaaA [Phaeobacter gallaeciensis]MDE4313179.1 peroxide stress protein YaaA [Phaeobacter gallaeciensis]MDE4317534.1 peroxide stress protein YaaA [Phaeobacter gallaeciensis]MDE4322114.1 peroxide stress protein YaaA [Phaeobacter gallaeciensis]
MLVVVSPAKKLDWEERDMEMTAPAFQEDAVRLNAVARELSVAELMKLMHISEDLAKLNYDRFRSFEEKPTTDSLRPAALAFAGDTYQGLEAASLDAEEMAWAQDHFRILSGLYGVLRPMDGMQPYRLEMGSRLKNERGKNLYEYWGSQIAEALNRQAEETSSDILVNCASQEYFGAVDLKALKPKVITPVFMEMKNDTPKVVSFYAKRARGAMARYIIQHRLNDAEALKDFDTGGYVYKPELSEPDKPVFLRG